MHVSGIFDSSILFLCFYLLLYLLLFQVQLRRRLRFHINFNMALAGLLIVEFQRIINLDFQMIRTFIDLDAVGRDAHDHLTVWSHITADIRTVLLKNHMRPRIASLNHIDAVRIGVIGTEATIRSGIYTREMQKLRPDIEVIGKPCPLFVPLVEEGLFHDSVTDEIASRYLSSLKEKYIDTLVMGCTHYPLLRSTLHRLMGDEVTLVNPAYETAVELKTLLRDMDLTRSSEDLERFSEENSRRAAAGEPILDQYQFFVSDRAENFTRFAKAILPNEVKDTKQINIEEY